MVTDGGITVQKGVIDHSLPSAVRRLWSVGARLIYCCQPSSAPRSRRQEGAHLLTYSRVIVFFLGLPHSVLLRVQMWRRTVHEVTLRGFCLTRCYDVMFCVSYVLDTLLSVSVLYSNPTYVYPSRRVVVVAYVDMGACLRLRWRVCSSV